MGHYEYGVLRADLSDEANKYNEALLGEYTLGIEVTTPSLAERCGLGNIDPQHGNESKSSAIEEALLYQLPPEGACLVTIRPDKDSLGAMAVITLRSLGKDIDRDLVAWIGVLDSMGFQNARNTRPDLMRPREETDAIQMIISLNEKWPSLEEKVYHISRILAGEMPRSEICAIAALKTRSFDNFEAEMHGSVAFVFAPGKYNQARDWGNRRYAVTIVNDPQYLNPHIPHRRSYDRWTMVRKLGKFDRRNFERSVNEAEARARGITVPELKAQGCAWGGPAHIVSSPVERESLLSKDVIINLARKCLESGQVS